MLNIDIFTTIFVEIDDFCKRFEAEIRKYQISDGQEHRNRQGQLSISEKMTIVVLFHVSRYRTFKHFYSYLYNNFKCLFPNLVSYPRFVQSIPSVLFPLSMYLLHTGKNKCTGISYIDSTKIEICGKKRMTNNQVFKGLAKIGKSSLGWFFGFKLHLVVNEQGDILAFAITKGNVDARVAVPTLVKTLFGKLFGDKGYISKKLSESLLNQGLQLFTTIKKNMKEIPIAIKDKLLLRKRSIIETINDQLKNISQIEHTRHRSPLNFLVNLIAGLTAYSFQQKKPSISINDTSPSVVA